MCTSSISNVIYHKVSHGTAFYTLNGKNVSVMLELFFIMWPKIESHDNIYISCLLDLTQITQSVSLYSGANACEFTITLAVPHTIAEVDSPVKEIICSWTIIILF